MVLPKAPYLQRFKGIPQMVYDDYASKLISEKEWNLLHALSDFTGFFNHLFEFNNFSYFDDIQEELSNQMTRSAEEILSCYSLQWTIETSFRDENQNIGFHECKFCLYAHQQLFLGITFLSYLFLARACTQSILHRYGDIKSTLGELNRAFEHYCQEEYVQYVQSLDEIVTCKAELNCLKTQMYSM